MTLKTQPHMRETATREERLEALLILAVSVLIDLHDGYSWRDLGFRLDDFLDDAVSCGIRYD